MARLKANFFLLKAYAKLKTTMIKKLVKKITPHFLLDFYHYLWAFAGAVVFGFPSRKLIVIGVTGTSGKSTTVDFITRILEEAGHSIVSNSSIRFKIAGKEWPNNLKMGMPGRFFMQQFLRQGVKAGCNYAVLEVTSEGIRQSRHKFINFDTAVFTNLSPEHIESHGGFENYRNEKLKLFRATKNVHAINSDDENAEYFLEVPAGKIIKFGLGNGDVNMGNARVELKVLGGFNQYNALAAIAVAKNYGISLETCKRALEKVTGVPGRMEIVNKNPLVVVDYAHTPDQLEKVYKSLQGKKLICVVGSCGGGRDKWKRPVLGKIASQYCDQIIITNEDPYDENPLSIMNEIESGFSQTLNSKSETLKYEKILDRRKAIKKAIQSAKPGDTVIITGKGSELWMCVENGKKISWDDREIAKEAISVR